MTSPASAALGPDGRAACDGTPSRSVPPGAQPPLNGATSGLVLEYSPAGLGYQTHTCIVVRSGCQKKNGDPVLGLVFGQVLEFSSGMNVPSWKWQAAGK